jgi:hypothetical protein
MKTIKEVLAAIGESLKDSGAGNGVVVEVWTLDGRYVADAGRGAKISIPFKGDERGPKTSTSPPRAV